LLAPKMEMSWRGKSIVSISREFLDTNGVTQHAKAIVSAPDAAVNPFAPQPVRNAVIGDWLDMLGFALKAA